MMNSAAYDAALRQRVGLTVWFTDAAVASCKAELRITRGGQPRCSALAIATALTLRAVFRLALQQTEGLIGSILALLGLDLARPDPSPLSRRAETLELAWPRPGSAPVHLAPVHLAPVHLAPVHLGVDSTGVKLCGAGEWLLEKHGTHTRRSWRKLHVGVDADTGQIVAATLSPSNVDDASQVAPLLDQAGPLASFMADGACDQDGVYGKVARRSPDAAVIVPPRSSAVPSKTAGTAPTQPDRPLQMIARQTPQGLADAAGPGRKPRAVTGARWSRPTSAGSSGRSKRGCARARTDVARWRSPSPSAS